jgi:hypothetical protein
VDCGRLLSFDVSATERESRDQVQFSTVTCIPTAVRDLDETPALKLSETGSRPVTLLKCIMSEHVLLEYNYWKGGMSAYGHRYNELYDVLEFYSP